MRNKSFPSTLGILMIGHVLLAMFYVFCIPPWQGADEPTHFEQIILVHQSGVFSAVKPLRLNVDIQRQILETFDEYRFWHYVGTNSSMPPPTAFTDTPFLQLVPSQRVKPLLYYRIAAFALHFYPGSDILVQLYLIRILGVLLSLAGVLALWRIGQCICFREQGMVLVCTAASLLLPQYLITTTSISNEALFLPLYFFFIAVLISPEFLSRVWYVLLLLLLASACIFTDRMGYITLPMMLIHHRKIVWQLGQYYRTLFYGFTTLLLLSPIVSWYAPVIPYKILDQMTLFYLKLPFGQFVGEHLMIGMSEFFYTLVKSFFCAPGWMRFSFSGPVITVIISIYLTALFGWVIAFLVSGERRVWEELGVRSHPMISLLINTMLIMLVIMTGYYHRGFHAQGRFLLPVIWPIMTTSIVGLVCLFRYIGIAARNRKAIILTLLVLLQVHAISTVLLSVFVIR